MILCNRGLNWIQIIDHKGTVRICSWMQNNEIGKLTEQSMEELYHGDVANRIRENLACGNYSDCIVDGCPYLSNRTVNEHLVEVDEISKYPEEVHLAYEQVCNYRCTSCNVHQIMQKNVKVDLESDYDKIEEELKKVLPYVKRIGANGCGELFVSKRIMRLLSEWKPLAPKEEIKVLLESNGSLFNEENWKKIENLGQYYLHVAITVMSFDEAVYQELSGTKLPIENIEKNLLFVKSLREKGIIDYLEIATVVQDKNFRMLPEFTRKCIEEFGADYVRLRPYMPWGSRSAEIEWYTDIRNKYHPYNQEYLEVMKHPIFKHPKVHDWGGGQTSSLGEHPAKIAGRMVQKKLDVVTDIIMDDEFREKLVQEFADKKVAIYGIGNVGKVLVKLMINKFNISYLIDKSDACKDLLGKKVYSLSEINIADKNVAVIVTLVRGYEKVKKLLIEKGYKEIYSIVELLDM